jgi:hypothetical protein
MREDRCRITIRVPTLDFFRGMPARALTDDAFDFFICVMTNGKVTEDRAGRHCDLLIEFPYMGRPTTTQRDRCAGEVCYLTRDLAPIDPRPRFPNRRALMATMTVLTDISTAPKAGVSTIPQGAATPAASGIANAL